MLTGALAKIERDIFAGPLRAEDLCAAIISAGTAFFDRDARLGIDTGVDLGAADRDTTVSREVGHVLTEALARVVAPGHE